MSSFLERNLPEIKDRISVTTEKKDYDEYSIVCENGKLDVHATSFVAACSGIYDYLKEYCDVQLSWCSNNEIKIDSLCDTNGVFSKRIQQKYRVYMNYCTLNYTASWWDFSRWEKEIDLMAFNGVNMPLCVVGTEAVWFETLLELGYSEKEALETVSGPAFWAWQLMTNIEGYCPPKSKKYIYERLELGRKILKRINEFGMQPIQQGFSGHVPLSMKKKFKKSKIYLQRGWCKYPQTAQVDPLDPLFSKFGMTYLKKLDELLGNYHYIACDPFHEGTPPKNTEKYLSGVGKAINDLYFTFDKNSVWVMQAWTMRKEIVCAVPKERLLLLDLDSDRATKKNDYLWGYEIVAGMLHNFGGKNAMQGQLLKHCENRYLAFKKTPARVVGSGMFMEGIEQNPVIYDLQFEVLTADKEIDIDKWLDKYIKRRYGKFTPEMRQVWSLLLETCYKRDGYEENRVGSMLASRPAILPQMTGPCCYPDVYYDTDKFEEAAYKMLSVSPEYENVDAYQYDLCDIFRQAMSNRFYLNQKEYAKAYKDKDIERVHKIAEAQLDILTDLDFLLSHRKEMTLSHWINDAHNLAVDDEEKKYFDFNARLLITSWGDIRSSTEDLFDYAWREWNGLISEYYFVRWKRFYEYVEKCMKSGRKVKETKYTGYAARRKYLKYKFGRELNKFELEWANTYSEYPLPENKNVIPVSEKLARKWGIGSDYKI